MRAARQAAARRAGPGRAAGGAAPLLLAGRRRLGGRAGGRADARGRAWPPAGRAGAAGAAGRGAAGARHMPAHCALDRGAMGSEASYSLDGWSLPLYTNKHDTGRGIPAYTWMSAQPTERQAAAVGGGPDPMLTARWAPPAMHAHSEKQLHAAARSGPAGAHMTQWAVWCRGPPPRPTRTPRRCGWKRLRSARARRRACSCMMAGRARWTARACAWTRPGRSALS